MPCLHEALVVADHETLDLPEFRRPEPGHAGQRDRLQPELGQGIFTLHMDMRRFGAFVAEEEEPVCPESSSLDEADPEPLVDAPSGLVSWSKPLT